MKARLKGAQTGHSMLKKKADALQLRFRTILKKIIDVSIWHKLLQKITIFKQFFVTIIADQVDGGWFNERGVLFVGRG